MQRPNGSNKLKKADSASLTNRAEYSAVSATHILAPSRLNENFTHCAKQHAFGASREAPTRPYKYFTHYVFATERSAPLNLRKFCGGLSCRTYHGVHHFRSAHTASLQSWDRRYFAPLNGTAVCSVIDVRVHPSYLVDYRYNENLFVAKKSENPLSSRYRDGLLYRN